MKEKYLVLVQSDERIENVHVVEASSPTEAELSIEDRYGLFITAFKLSGIVAPWKYHSR